jgi:hypothetical protein
MCSLVKSISPRIPVRAEGENSPCSSTLFRWPGLVRSAMVLLNMVMNEAYSLRVQRENSLSSCSAQSCTAGCRELSRIWQGGERGEGAEWTAEGKGDVGGRGRGLHQCSTASSCPGRLGGGREGEVRRGVVRCRGRVRGCI